MLDAVCLGEALIDFVSTASVAPGASVADAPAFVPAAGGSPANAAVALARLGVRTGFVGKVGDDPFGRHLARTLAGHGVDTSRLRLDATARTALAFVALDPAGHPDFVFFRHPSADMLLRPDELDVPYVTGARAYHTGSIALAAEPTRSTALAAARLARAAGRLVSVDPNVRLSVWRDAAELREVLLPLMALADVVKLSDEDLPPLAGTGDAAAGSAALLGLGARLVVVTRGRDGCLARTPAGVLAAPGYRVPVVDTTGAGDAFLAGLLAGLLGRGAPERAPAAAGAAAPAALAESELHAVLRLANAVGALTTTARGAIPALPDRLTLRRFLAEQADAEAVALLP